MPRSQRPAFEVAVAASPLFKLAPKIRIMIYELLLVREGGTFIPNDMFSRRKHKKTGYFQNVCFHCGLAFLSKNGCIQHEKKHSGWRDTWHRGVSQHRLPGISISLLETCRIIRLEASHILYSKNRFNFSDPAAASNFRWGTDCAQAGAIQEMGVRMCFPSYSLRPWLTYFEKRTHSLCQDFPHLRRMTINLGTWTSLGSDTILRSMAEKLGERSQGLEWVLVLCRVGDKMLDCFEPSVDR